MLAAAWARAPFLVLVLVLPSMRLLAADAPPGLLLRALRPTHGPEEGSRAVSVIGEGFREGLSVLFGGRPAERVVVLGPRLALVVPPAGQGEVEVRLEVGQERAWRERAFAYLPPEADPDRDGVSYAAEIARGTSPFSPDTDLDGLPDPAETSTGVFRSAEDAGTDPLLADTDGGGTPDGEEVEAETNPLRFEDDGSEVALPLVLTGAGGFRWDIERNGKVWDGTDDAFDGGAGLTVGGRPFPGVARARLPGGRQLVLGPVELGGLSVTRRIFISPELSFARYVEVLENPGPESALAVVEVATDLGSDLATSVAASSGSGLDASSRWVITDDAEDPGGDPAVLHYLSSGEGDLALEAARLEQGVLTFRFSVAVPAGKRRAVLHLLGQARDRAGARAIADVLEAGPLRAAGELSLALLLDAGNWAADRDADGMPDGEEVRAGLDPRDPLDAGGDRDGDGLANLDEFRGGTSPGKADTDGDGLLDGDERAAGAHPRLADTDGDGLEDLLDPYPATRVRARLSGPAWAPGGETARLELLLLDRGGYPLPPPAALRLVLRTSAGTLASGTPGRVLEGEGTAEVLLETEAGAAAVLLRASPGETALLYLDDPDGLGLALEGLPGVRFLEPEGDADGDGESNARELARGTDPTRADTDGDGLPDGAESGSGRFVSPDDAGTDPLAADSDGDGAGDGLEARTGSHPLDPSRSPERAAEAPRLIGDVIQVGVNLDGSLITEEGGLGLRYDPPGPAPPGPDLLAGGVPLEAFGISYQEGEAGRRVLLQNGAPDPDTGSDFPLEAYWIDREGPTLRAAWVGEAGPLALVQVVELRRALGGVRIRVRLRNRGELPLDGLTYLRSADIDGLRSPLTAGDVVEAGVAAAHEPASGLRVVLGSYDRRAVASVEGFGALDPAEVLDSPADPEGNVSDESLQLGFRLGDLAAGQAVELTLVYAASPDLEEALDAFRLLFDTDGDGVPDRVEEELGLDPRDPADGAFDLDGDGLTNSQEAAFRSRLDRPDTDGDGLLDSAEHAGGTNPRVKDTDGDGLDDAEDPFPRFPLVVRLLVPTGGLAGLPAPVRVTLEAGTGEPLPPEKPLRFTLRSSAGFFGPAAARGRVLAGGGTGAVEAEAEGGELALELTAAEGERAEIAALDTSRLGFGDAPPAILEFFAAERDADGDGLTNAQEIARSTWPRRVDSDNDGLLDSVETGDGIGLGPWSPGTSPSLADTDGGGTEDGYEAWLGRQALERADDGLRLTLPTLLPKADYGNYVQVQEDGSIPGGSGAFDVGMKLRVAGQPFPSFSQGFLVDHNSDLLIGPADVEGLRVWRRVGHGGSFLRWLEILENPSSAPRTVEVEVTSLLAAGSRAAVAGSSSGDQALDPSDFWFAAADPIQGFPSVLLLFRGDTREASGAAELSGGRVRCTWRIEVPAHGRAAIVHAAAESWYLPGLVDPVFANSLVANLLDYGIQPGARRTVANFRPDTDGDGLPDAVEAAHRLDPRNPADGFLDEDGDGLSNAAEVVLDTNLSVPDTDADGLPDGRELALRLSPHLRDSDRDGKDDGVDPYPACQVEARLAAPRGALVGEALEVVLLLSRAGGGPLPPPGEVSVGLEATVGAFAERAEEGELVSGGGTGAVVLAASAGRARVRFAGPAGRRIRISAVDKAGVGLAGSDRLVLEFYTPGEDPDGDGIPSEVEIQRGTSPRLADTDRDGLADALERGTGVDGGPGDPGTDPLRADTDGDGLSDGLEVTLGSKPLDAASLPEKIDEELALEGDRLRLGFALDGTLRSGAHDVGLRHRKPGGAFGADLLEAGAHAETFALRVRFEAGDLLRVNTADPFESDLPAVALSSFLRQGDEVLEVVSMGSIGPLALVQSLRLARFEAFVRLRVEIRNTGAITVPDIRYLRSLDGASEDGSPSTRSDLLNSLSAVSWSNSGNGAVAVGTADPRAVATAHGMVGLDPDIAGFWSDPNGQLGDAKLHLGFYAGSLAPGESAVLELAIACGDTKEEAVQNLTLAPDADRDGLPDILEQEGGLDPLDGEDALFDPDGDGLPSLLEYRLGTALGRRDTDSDGLDDGVEVQHGLDPLRADAGEDADGDGLSNGQEIARGIDPRKQDTDGDGIGDGLEVEHGLDPRLAADGAGDLDGDGLSNTEEVALGTGLTDPDSDRDGLADGAERRAGTGPLTPDSDGDELADGEEALLAGTDPLRPDTDQDGFADRPELEGGGDPRSGERLPPGSLREEFESGETLLELAGAARVAAGALVLAPAGEAAAGAAFRPGLVERPSFATSVAARLGAGEGGRAAGLSLLVVRGGTAVGVGLEGLSWSLSLELAPGGEPHDRDNLIASWPGEEDTGRLPGRASVLLPADLAAPGEVLLSVEARGGWARVSLARRAEAGGEWGEPFITELAAPLPVGPARVGLAAQGGEGRGALEVLGWKWQPTGAVALEALSPASGSLRGGEEVRIRGESLAAGEALRAFLGVEPLAGLVPRAPRELAGLTPRAAWSGPRDLLVFTEDGMGRLRNAFTYGPVLLAVDPPSGRASGGEVVRLYVAGLAGWPDGPLPRVLFAGREAAEVRRPLEGVVLAIAPGGAEHEEASVEVAGPDGEASALPHAYRYLPSVRVPEDVRSIAGAILEAPSGAIIELAPGRYTESVVITGKNLEIRGREGAAATLLLGRTGNPALRIEGGAEVTLRGLTITRPPPLSSSAGRGVIVRAGSACTVIASVITGHWSTRGGGVLVESGASLEVQRSRVTRNRATGAGGGILVEAGARAWLASSLIASNSSAAAGGGLATLAAEPGAVRLQDCTLAGNDSVLPGAGLHVTAAGALEVSGAVFHDNRPGAASDIAGASPGSVSGSLLGTDGLVWTWRNIAADLAAPPLEPATFRPLPGSVVLDRGGPAPAATPWDLDGLPRVADADADGRALEDLGAFEAAPRPRISLEFAPSVEAGLTVSLRALVEGPWEAVAWDFGDGTPLQRGGAEMEHRYPGVGRYQVTARVLLLDFAAETALSVPVGPPAMRGDCSPDGRRGIEDPIVLLTHLFLRRAGSLPCPAACDVNGSGTLTITDAIMLLHHLFAGGPLDPPRSCADDGLLSPLPCPQATCAR